MNAQTRPAATSSIVGGGMITHDQILPSLYHLQRSGAVGRDHDLRPELGRRCGRWPSAPAFAEAFPGPDVRAAARRWTSRRSEMFPDLYQEVIAALPPRNLVVVAVPDHFHYPVIRAALEHDQHVLTVKPLVLKYAQAVEIEQLARGRGLFVGVEYHKRFDRRSLDARRQYRARPVRRVPLRRGQAGRAVLLPPLELPELVHQGEQRPVHLHRLPLRRPGVLHHGPAAGRGLGPRRRRAVPQRQRRLPLVGRPGRLGERGDAERAQRPGLSRRGRRHERPGPVHVLRRRRLRRASSGTTTSSAACSHGYVDRQSGAAFRYVSPDYFRLVPWEGDGLQAGRLRLRFDRGHRRRRPSRSTPRATACGDEALAQRQQVLDEIDRRGILATPANSSINELVTEAARLSIQRDGAPAVIDYGDDAGGAVAVRIDKMTIGWHVPEQRRDVPPGSLAASRVQPALTPCGSSRALRRRLAWRCACRPPAGRGGRSTS